MWITYALTAVEARNFTLLIRTIYLQHVVWIDMMYAMTDTTSLSVWPVSKCGEWLYLRKFDLLLRVILEPVLPWTDLIMMDGNYSTAILKQILVNKLALNVMLLHEILFFSAENLFYLQKSLQVCMGIFQVHKCHGLYLSFLHKRNY